MHYLGLLILKIYLLFIWNSNLPGHPVFYLAALGVYRGHWSALVCLRKPHLSGNDGGAGWREAGGGESEMEQG